MTNDQQITAQDLGREKAWGARLCSVLLSSSHTEPDNQSNNDEQRHCAHSRSLTRRTLGVSSRHRMSTSTSEIAAVEFVIAVHPEYSRTCSAEALSTAIP